MKRQCTWVNPETGERCRSPFATKASDYQLCRAHSLSREEFLATSARGGRRDSQRHFEEVKRYVEQAPPRMSEADKLRVADVIANLLRATTLNVDTGALVPAEDERKIGAFLGAMFYGDGDDPGMQ